jgi:hypothetical protein
MAAPSQHPISKSAYVKAGYLLRWQGNIVQHLVLVHQQFFAAGAEISVPISKGKPPPLSK